MSQQLTIRPLFVFLTPTGQGTATALKGAQLARLNADFAKAGIHFSADAPIVALPGFDRDLNLETDRALLKAALRTTLEAETGGKVPDISVVPVYVGRLASLPTNNGGRSALHGYADIWDPQDPYAGIYVNYDRLPGYTVPHPESGTMQPTDGTTMVHEFGHLLADLEHQFTPGHSCVHDAASADSMNIMDYDADRCRGQWTPAQLAALRARTALRLQAGRGITLTQRAAMEADLPTGQETTPLWPVWPEYALAALIFAGAALVAYRILLFLSKPVVVSQP